VICTGFVGKGNFQGFVEVWFSDFFGYSWQKIKANHEPSRCLRRDPEDNEMSLIRN
jgi:hypothetical protein